MKVILDLNGWRRTEEVGYAALSGVVDCALYAPLNILVKDGLTPAEEVDGVKVSFYHRGKRKGSLPIFEYIS